MTLRSHSFRKPATPPVDHLRLLPSLSTLPVSAAVQPASSQTIPASPPNDGEEWSRIDDDYHTIIMPGITRTGNTRISTATSRAMPRLKGAIADLYCASISNSGFNWSVSPSVTELEILMVDWVGRMLGLDEAFLSTSRSGKGGGVILGSASEVALTVAIAARERYWVCSLSSILCQPLRMARVEQATA